MPETASVALTERHKEIIQHLVTNLLSNEEIAERLGVTTPVIKGCMERIYRRAGIEGCHGSKRVKLWRKFRPEPEKVVTNARFTNTEWLIALMVAEGASNNEIAARMQKSVQVIKNHLRTIFDRAGVWTRLELAAWVDSHYRPDFWCAAN